MTIKILVYHLLGLLSLTISCHSERYRVEFEKKVLNQLFKELTDSLVYYQSFPPPPPPPMVDFSDNIIDTSNIVLYRKLIARIDTSKKVIAMSDSTRLDKNFKEWIDLYHPLFDSLNFRLKIDDLIKSKSEVTKIDTSQIINTGRYELMNLSNFNKIQTKHPVLEYYFIYYGNLTLSRIYFDKSYDKGFLTCEITGRFFHYSYLIFIKTDSSKWVITRMKQLSMD